MPDNESSGSSDDLHCAVGKISNAEKHFLSQLIASPSKEVCLQKLSSFHRSFL